GVKKELKQKGIDDPEIMKKLFDILELSGKDWTETINRVEKIVTNDKAKAGISELRELYSYLDAMGISDKCILLLSLARGLEIYTGTVFEVFTADRTFKSSLAAGGRYDRIIGGFSGNASEVPAVGISFGLESIHGVLKSTRAVGKKTVTELLIIPVKNVDMVKVFTMAKELRNEGIYVEIELMDIKVKKSLDRANKQGIEHVSVVGPREIESGKINLKVMSSGEQSLITLEEAIQVIKSNR
ncbi:MAG: His/Gly/Thr/Pro-type tRNA ligase C-terminal domain-containing protein, partial [Candidatus Hodarchaeales archaeon]